jgi:hypothetical protein
VKGRGEGGRKYDGKFNLTKYCSLETKKENLYEEQNVTDEDAWEAK